MKKYLAGFIFGLASVAASQVIAACFDEGSRMRGINLMVMSTGELIHCPVVTVGRKGVLLCLN